FDPGDLAQRGRCINIRFGPVPARSRSGLQTVLRVLDNRALRRLICKSALRMSDLEKDAQMGRSSRELAACSGDYPRPIMMVRAATGTARPATTCPCPSLLE